MSDILKFLFSNNSIISIVQSNFIETKNEDSTEIKLKNNSKFLILFYSNNDIKYKKYNQIISKISPSVSNCLFGKCNDINIMNKLNLSETSLCLFKDGKIITNIDTTDETKILNICLL